MLSQRKTLVALLLAALLVSMATLGVSATDGSARWVESGDIQLQQEEGQEGSTSSGNVGTPGGDLPGDLFIQLVKVADGLIDPINVVSAPDGSGRLFVVERPGTIRIFDGGVLVEEPFLDITEIVLSTFLEQGLYDLEFHPDFAENGQFYVHFSELMRNGDSMNVQYQVSQDNQNVADPESAKVILQIDQPWANHNGGELAFGPDGYLYIGSGDGGWEGDPLEAGESLDTLLGKILRIDVNTGDDRPYAIPEDNPFAQPEQLIRLFGITEEEFAQIHTEARPEIWAYGLRNPWKFSFDRETGDLYIAEVGQNMWEEIDFQPADSQGGENYGWDFLMGSHCFPIQAETCDQVGVLPVAEYNHDLGCAVVGIGVYRGDEFSAMDGIYFSGDYCSGRIWGLAQNEGEWAFEELLDTSLQLTGAGDGEADEGQIWEATMGAAKFGADNLIAILDHNQFQQTGPVDEVMPPLQPYAEKWQAFGWYVIEVDGHDMQKVLAALKDACKVKGQPQMIVAHTKKGRGLSPFEKNDINRKHGTALSEEELDVALMELDAMYGGSRGER